MLHGFVGTAEGHGAASLRLQRQGSDFHDMCQRQLLGCSMRLQRADSGEARTQLFFKAGDGGIELLVVFAVHDGFNSGAASPEVGATQSSDAGDLHSFSFRWQADVRSAVRSYHLGASVWDA